MMALKTIDLEITPLTLEELLAELNPNTEVLLTRGNDPIAHITPAETPPKPKQRVFDLNKGEIWMSDDFTDELPMSFWLGEDK